MAIGQPSLYDLHRLMGSIGHTLAQIIWHADSHCIKLFSHLYIFFYISFCVLCMQFVNFISIYIYIFQTILLIYISFVNFYTVFEFHRVSSVIFS